MGKRLNKLGYRKVRTAGYDMYWDNSYRGYNGRIEVCWHNEEDYLTLFVLNKDKRVIYQEDTDMENIEEDMRKLQNYIIEFDKRNK